MPPNLKILLLTAVALTIVAVCVLNYQFRKQAIPSTKHHLRTEAQFREDERQAQQMAKEMIRKERQQQKANQGH